MKQLLERLCSSLNYLPQYVSVRSQMNYDIGQFLFHIMAVVTTIFISPCDHRPTCFYTSQRDIGGVAAWTPARFGCWPQAVEKSLPRTFYALHFPTAAISHRLDSQLGKQLHLLFASHILLIHVAHTALQSSNFPDVPAGHSFSCG